jgi:hypothetical protein
MTGSGRLTKTRRSRGDSQPVNMAKAERPRTETILLFMSEMFPRAGKIQAMEGKHELFGTTPGALTRESLYPPLHGPNVGS